MYIYICKHICTYTYVITICPGEKECYLQERGNDRMRECERERKREKKREKKREREREKKCYLHL